MQPVQLLLHRTCFAERATALRTHQLQLHLHWVVHRCYLHVAMCATDVSAHLTAALAVGGALADLTPLLHAGPTGG